MYINIYDEILIKIDNIMDEDNPFLYIYYNQLCKIRKGLKKNIYINEKYIEEINNLLEYGFYYDNFSIKLDYYLNKLENKR